MISVEMEDVLAVLQLCKPYIIGIIAALVIGIVIMVACRRMSRDKRFLIRGEAVIAMVLAVVVCVNMICFGPMATLIGLATGNGTLSDETNEEAAEVAEEIMEDGIVLLKNESLLPLNETKKLNIFGWESINPAYGGAGSGGINDLYDIVSLNQGLENAGFSINQKLVDFYNNYGADDPEMSIQKQSWTLPEPPVDTYSDELIKSAKEYSDVAVVVLSRKAGEGHNDIPMDVRKAAYDNNSDEYDDFPEGEHYLQLSQTERDMVDMVCSNFDNVIVIYNGANQFELGFADEYPQIKSVVWCPGTGNVGFNALGKVFSGEVNPSGKTPDTFIYDMTTAPWWNNAEKTEYTNLADMAVEGMNAGTAQVYAPAFTNYVEGIYVGYKYYETAAQEGAIDYDKTVQYPFGYGLSYTTFDKTIENFKDNGDTVTFDVTVKNTGDVAGKDVIELYYTAPYTNGGIEKASANLIAFEKTETLDPGAAETKSITINKEDMASYDSEGIKISGGGYILEAGEYTISLRSDSHTVVAEEKFTVDSDIDYSKDGRSSDETVATNQFEDYSRGDFEQLSRANGFANYESACGKLSEDAYVMSDETRKAVEENVFGIYDGTKYNDDSDEMPKMEQDNGLQLADLTGKSYDDEDWDKLLDQLSFEDMSTLINVGGWQTAEIQSVGKIATSDCDGPAGLNNFITKTYGTAYPSEVLIAQTWNKDLAKEVGDSMGQEYVDADNFGWYGPAMNIHRSAFAGRNFEYYSEDGVLSGYMAANEMNGAAVKGVYPYIKHFALNDQETNRCSFLLTFASEQTIREGYLKAFELAVKGFEGNAIAAMSSFNWIGTVPSCANNGLLNNVLRGEWGFVGMVETDYDGSYGYMITDHCIRNGNDLMLGFNSAESNKLTDESATAVLAMRQACKNILYTVANSGYYADGNPAAGMSNMTKLFVTVDVILAVLLIVADAIVIVRFRKKRKNVDNAEA